jgi:hypothetical protein
LPLFRYAGALCHKLACGRILIREKLTLSIPSTFQAALPQGIVPFVFAKEYNVHPDILSTAYDPPCPVYLCPCMSCSTTN